MGVDECAISYWDRAAGRVDSLGYYPAAQGRARWSRATTSAAIPETLRVLERQETVIIDADDPAADPAEVALLDPRRQPRAGDAAARRQGRSRSAWSSCSRARPIDLGRRAPPAGPDDGQRGRDGARERPPLRGRPQPRRPRPADRLLQPPVPARAPRRGGGPRPAWPPAAEPADARPRRLQARQRHVRPPLRRPCPGLDRRAASARRCGHRTCRPATAATSSRSSCPRPMPPRPGPPPAASSRRSATTRSSGSSAGRCRSRASIGVATFPLDGGPARDRSSPPRTGPCTRSSAAAATTPRAAPDGGRSQTRKSLVRGSTGVLARHRMRSRLDAGARTRHPVYPT